MKETTEQRNVDRLNTIGMFDLSKGILMLMVLLGHSITLFLKYWELKDISVWGVVPLLLVRVFSYGLIPMFFIMSGYGFRKQKGARRIRNRTSFLLKAYVLVAVAVISLAVLKAVLQGNSVVSALQYQGFPFLLGICPGETEVFGFYTSSIGPLWFLVALLVSWISLNLLFRLESEGIRVVLLVTLVAACTQLPFYAVIPFCIIQSVCCSGYMYIGYCMKETKIMAQGLSKQAYVILILVFMCALPFGNVEVSQNVWKLGFFDYVVSAIAGVLFCMWSIHLERLKGRFAKELRWFGKNSLYILCIHTIEYLVFPWDRVAIKFGENTIVGIIALFFVRVIIASVGCVLVNRIVKLTRKWK